MRAALALALAVTHRVVHTHLALTAFASYISETIAGGHETGVADWPTVYILAAPDAALPLATPPNAFWKPAARL